MNRSNRNWHADAQRSRRKQWRTATREKRSLSETIMDPDRWPLSSFSQDQRVGRSFCSRSFDKKRTRGTRSPLFFTFSLLFRSRDFHIPDTRNITFRRTKIFFLRERNSLYVQNKKWIEITEDLIFLVSKKKKKKTIV